MSACVYTDGNVIACHTYVIYARWPLFSSILEKQLAVILRRSSSNRSARDMADPDRAEERSDAGGPPGAPGGRLLSLLGLPVLPLPLE